MKKENFIIGLIGVAVVAFLLGRFSVSTTPKKTDDKTAATKKTDGDEKTPKTVDNKAAKTETAGATKTASTDKTVKKVAVAKATTPDVKKPTAADLNRIRKANIAKRVKRPATRKAPANAKKPAAAVRRLPPAKPGTPLNVVDSPRKGPANAKVTIVEVSDFQ
jgi:cytoskeletal protein RodZ